LPASSALASTEGNSTDISADKEEKKESDSDESDDQWSSDISDSELDIDNFYFLQVLLHTFFYYLKNKITFELFIFQTARSNSSATSAST
jgi:hypothetical protein